jgi:hypothetical protein
MDASSYCFWIQKGEKKKNGNSIYLLVADLEGEKQEDFLAKRELCSSPSHPDS